MNRKQLLYRNLVSISSMWAHLPRWQVAFGYVGCGAMDILGTNCLVA
jgi:hypothetical protein